MENAIDLNVLANYLRSKSVVWRDAKNELDHVKEVEFSQVSRKWSDLAQLEKVLGSTNDYVAKKVSGGYNNLASDEFIVDYAIQCNMDRSARYEAADCLSMEFKVNWKLRDVKVHLYDGESSKVHIPTNLNDIVDDSTNLRNVLKTASTGQSKITRLVKGCLMYLDHIGKGPVLYHMPRMETMVYGLDHLGGEMSFNNRAYVFSGTDYCDVSNWILYSICEEYPHPVIGGVDHISIPADADQVFLVGYNPRKMSCKVVIASQLIWGSLIIFANNFGLREDLERAMAIACSLRQNRYLVRVGLPRVISKIDMIYPVLGSMRGGVSNSILDRGTPIIIGRVHQMLMMLLVKDVDVSARSTGRTTDFLDRDVLSLLCKNSHSFQEYIEDKSVAGFLKITAPMKWMEYLDEEALGEIRKHSVFEGFWLLKNPKEVFRGGVISRLKKGMKHPLGMKVDIGTDSFSILMNEIVLGGGPTKFVIPDGAFNVSYTCMFGPKRRSYRRVLRFTGHRGHEGPMLKLNYEDPPNYDGMSGLIKEDAWGWEEKSHNIEDDVGDLSSGEKDDDEEEVFNLCQNLTIREA